MPPNRAANADTDNNGKRATAGQRGRRRLRTTLMLGLVVVTVAGLIAVNWPLFVGDWDTRVISASRAKHRAMWALGQTLPGTPDLAALDKRLADGGFTLRQPILIRIFKREFELEIWKAKDGRYHRFATYPICRWSGKLGPKLKTGDRQAPEGFYSVSKSQLNPNSRWHRSFNLGFPNTYDRGHGRTGSFLMVHGGCSSVGCYAMTNAVIDEIWQLVTSALDAGQKSFQVQAFPFRMSEENLATKVDDPLYPFWLSLKQGFDLFEKNGIPPRVRVCRGAYAFLPGNRVSDDGQSATASCEGLPPASGNQES